MSTYEVQVERTEGGWLVHVPQIGHTTQARSLREVDVMARDLIVVMSQVTGDTPLLPEGVDLDVHVQLPESVRKHLARAAELREQELDVRQEAAKEARAAARELSDEGLTLRDIGAALGVSHQRAQQLINA